MPRSNSLQLRSLPNKTNITPHLRQAIRSLQENDPLHLGFYSSDVGILHSAHPSQNPNLFPDRRILESKDTEQMPESACNLRNEHGDELGGRLDDTGSPGAIIVVLADANLEEDKDCCVAGSGWSRCSFQCHPLGFDRRPTERRQNCS
jgi:hypothetical protein